MSVNINPDDLDPGGGDGESLWTQLGKGLAKILTAILDLLTIRICSSSPARRSAISTTTSTSQLKNSETMPTIKSLMPPNIILDLLKVLIFKGLDALGYLAGVMVENIGTVFSGIGAYFDRYIGYIEENTFFAGISGIFPEELETFMYRQYAVKRSLECFHLLTLFLSASKRSL